MPPQTWHARWGRPVTMVKKYTFDQVDVLLVDTDLNARQGVRTILANNGFTGVTLGTGLQRVKTPITQHMPDIMLCGTEFPDGKITDLLRDIRHNRIGNNPFMPVIVFLDEPTPELVADVLSAGPDDVVMKPVSTRALLDRLGQQIHKRKPYIVTDDCVGPARKGDDTSRAIVPPNPLHAKANGGKASFHEVERGIQDALSAVNDRRLENTGPEIAALVGRLVLMLDKPTVTEAAKGGLQMLIEMNQDVINRLEGSRYVHVSELCRAMIIVCERIKKDTGGPADKTQVRLLKPLSQSIQAGFSGGIANAQAARAIAQKIGIDLG